MTIRPPGPDEPPEQDGKPGRRTSLTTPWALALERFRDYLHWTAQPAGDPRHDPGGPRYDQGETHDPDR